MGTPANRLADIYEQRNQRIGKRVLLMMTRYPEPGKVKTRLAAGSSPAAAASIYRRCAERLFTAADRLAGPTQTIAYIADGTDRARVSDWTGARYEIMTQPSGDLGVRLSHGFTASFKNGAAAVIIAASDVPDMDSGILEAAFVALHRHDIVLGPSPDGGYYLVGLNEPATELFRNIPWSSGQVLEKTLHAAAKMKQTVHLLPPLGDIDTVTDWQDWLANRNTDTINEQEYAQTI
jgi:rSAM/selenodomain-associated transferase 1